MSRDELRELVRYERTIELAMEGFRLLDIRRWKIVEHVLPGYMLGKRTKADWYTPVVPAFSDYGKTQNIPTSRSSRNSDSPPSTATSSTAGPFPRPRSTVTPC